MITPKRLFFAMCGVNVLIFILIGLGVYFGGQVISTQAEKLTNAKARYNATQELNTQLILAKKSIEEYRDINELSNRIIPKDKNQAQTVLEIEKIASETGIPLKGIQFEASNLGQAAPPTARSGTGTPTTPATPAAPTITQAKPIDGIKGVFGIEIIVASQDESPVDFANLIQFLERLEANRRTAHVSNISIQPKQDSGLISFNITLTAYVKP